MSKRPMQAAQEAQQLQKDLLTDVGDLAPVLAIPAAFQDPLYVCEPLLTPNTPTGVSDHMIFLL